MSRITTLQPVLSEQDIFTHLVKLMGELFELSPDDIQPSSKLQEDLDLDSIDAVDLMVELKPIVGAKLNTEAFKRINTVQDVVNEIQTLLRQSEHENSQ